MEDLVVATVVSRLLFLKIPSIAEAILRAESKYDSVVSDFGESEGVLYSLVRKYFELVDEIVPSVLANTL